MASQLLAMAISAPDNLHWDLESRTFSWELAEDAPYCTYTFDGVTRGFIRYQCEQFEVDSQWLSPGVHTFCIYALDANLNSSEWRCLEIFIHDLSDTIVTEGPAMPINLQAWQSGANEITLVWQPGDESSRFCVFMDDRAVNYNVSSTIFVFRGVEPGTHTVGVSAWGEEGYVSDMASLTVFCQGAFTYTVELQRAHWSFEDDPEQIRGAQIQCNTERAEYAYSDSCALVLESEQGELAYVILPQVSDVADYDSLELCFTARGGYWSRKAEMWAKAAHDHHLVVGAMKSLPYTGFSKDSVIVLLDTTLTYAGMLTMDNRNADSLFFWRNFRIPLSSDTPPFLVLYGESARQNCFYIDDLRISRIAPQEPGDEPDNEPGEEPGDAPDSSLDEPGIPKIEKFIGPDGRLMIIRQGQTFDILGRIQ